MATIASETILFEGHPVVMVEFDDHQIFQIVVNTRTKEDPRYDYYDVSYRKKNESYYSHLHGFSSSLTAFYGAYWLAEGYIIDARWHASPEILIPLPGDIKDILEHMIDHEVVYCSKCDDYFPDTDWDVCEHLWWCEKCYQWSCPGERCKHRRPKQRW